MSVHGASTGPSAPLAPTRRCISLESAYHRGMSRRPVIGTCHICGDHGKLSFEHVPPKEAFNKRVVRRIRA
jgi:hypothetical protein